jgi:hypothetical protein
MAYTFEQLYKQVLEANINTITSSAFTVKIGNDINALLTTDNQPSSNYLLGVVQSGGGEQANSSEKVVSQQMIINLFVSQNYTQSFLQQLTTHIQTTNFSRVDIYTDVNGAIYYAAATGRTLQYSYYAVYNTPIVLESTLNIGLDYPVHQIVLTGVITYAVGTLLLLKDDVIVHIQDVSTTYFEFDNILSYQITSQALGDKDIYGTDKTTKLSVNGDEQNITFMLVYDPTDTAHKRLRRWAYMPPIARGFYVEDNSVLYNYSGIGVVRVNIIGAQNKVQTLAVSIVVSGALTETYTGGGA